MRSRSLYDFPELYDHLRTPDDETFEAVFNLITETLGRPPRSVMDPACGPATWLAHFCRHGIRIAGNDIDPAMVAIAEKKCGTKTHELIVGDMCDLKFRTSPFDVSFELSGTCGLLANEDNFKKFLKGVRKHTSPGGLILITVFFAEPQAIGTYPWLIGEWGPFSIASGGQAWLRYDVLANKPSCNIDYIRRTVRTEGVAVCPGPFIDEYEMFTWPEMHFWHVLESFTGLKYCSAFKYNDPSGIAIVEKGRFSGETTVVFRTKQDLL